MSTDEQLADMHRLQYLLATAKQSDAAVTEEVLALLGALTRTREDAAFLLVTLTLTIGRMERESRHLAADTFCALELPDAIAETSPHLATGRLIAAALNQDEASIAAHVRVVLGDQRVFLVVLADLVANYRLAAPAWIEHRRTCKAPS